MLGGENMEEIYYTNEYHFKDKKLHVGLMIHARNEEIANSILKIVNTDNFTIFEKRKFRFSKKIYTTIPPYELERNQMDEALKQLDHRRAFYKEAGITPMEDRIESLKEK